MMVLSGKSDCKLLPVAIMAHNEEKVIHKAVESVLRQNTPTGFTIKVVVVANGCSDRTEEVIESIRTQYPEQIVLLSLKEKGKTRALNRSINYLNELSDADRQIPYVVFLDADCEFYGEEILVDMIKRFEENPQLCAVAANCLPDVFFNSRHDIVAEIYRAVYRLSESLKINAISGMCYGIRFDILNKISFPDFQLSDSQYISSKLDGWFFRDTGIKIIFKIPFGLKNEIIRRTRQEVSNQRYREYYSSLRKRKIRIKLFETALGDDFRWKGALDDNILNKWLGLKGIKQKCLIIIFYLICVWSKIIATFKVKRMKTYDIYWEVKR